MQAKKIIILVLIIMLCIDYIYAEEDTKEQAIETHYGFIFSSTNILLDLNDYNGGVGFKMVLPKFSARFMADFGYSNSSNIISGDLGLMLEKRLREGRIIPYFGGGLQLGIEHEKVVSDADNWTKQLTFPVELSGILGVEVFLLEFLSIFAEYNLSLQFAIVNFQQNVNGTITDNSNWSFDIGTGLGNGGRLGIVIYLNDVVKIDNK